MLSNGYAANPRTYTDVKVQSTKILDDTVQWYGLTWGRQSNNFFRWGLLITASNQSRNILDGNDLHADRIYALHAGLHYDINRRYSISADAAYGFAMGEKVEKSGDVVGICRCTLSYFEPSIGMAVALRPNIQLGVQAGIFQIDISHKPVTSVLLRYFFY